MAALWSDFDRETLRETKNLIRCICGEEDEEEDNFQLALRFTCSNFRSEEGAANIRLTWKLSVSIYRLSVCFCFSTQFSSFPGRGQSQSSAQHHWVRAWMHWSMSEYMSECMSESMAGRSSVWPSVVRVHLFVLSIYMKLMVHSELNKAESWMKLTEEFLTSPLPNTEGTKVCVWFCVCVCESVSQRLALTPVCVSPPDWCSLQSSVSAPPPVRLTFQHRLHWETPAEGGGSVP